MRVRIVSATLDEVTFEITTGARDGERIEIPTYGMILPPNPALAQFVDEILRVASK